MKKTLHLVLTHHWFDEIANGNKTIEYRALKPVYIKRILNNRMLETIIFHRGYTAHVITADIRFIDVGHCPYDGWDGDYIRIHFKSPSPCIDNPVL